MDILLALTLLLAPTYVIRFNLLGLPFNLLMLWIVLVWIIFVAEIIRTKRIKDFITYLKSLDKKIVWATAIFLLAGLISTFVRGLDKEKIGQFIVLFFQPISLFFIFGYLNKKVKRSGDLFFSAGFLFAGVSGIYAIIQYFTLLGLPVLFQGNPVEPKRALSFFVHPNFYALFLAPLLALLIPQLVEKIKDAGWAKSWKRILAWLLGGVGLLLSLSRSGWLGLSAAVVIYIIFVADKKIKQLFPVLLLAAALLIIYVPALNSRVLSPVYGDRSASSRLILWNAGWQEIKKSPVLGQSLTGFAHDWDTMNIQLDLDTHNYPHNIFLDVWVETGILGLISFIYLAGLYIFRGIKPALLSLMKRAKNRKTETDLIYFSISLFLLCLLIQGQVDNPYFKNDLAVLFWMVLSLVS